MENAWADPAGFESRPNPVKYRIRYGDNVVERFTQQAIDPITKRWHHSLNANDHAMSLEIRSFIQQACSYYYADAENYTPLQSLPWIEISDEEVRARIDRLNRGENMREAVRTHSAQYPFDELPWDQQRALIEQIEAVKQRWGFEIVGESAEPTPNPFAQPIADRLGDEV